MKKLGYIEGYKRKHHRNVRTRFGRRENSRFGKRALQLGTFSERKEVRFPRPEEKANGDGNSTTILIKLRSKIRNDGTLLIYFLYYVVYFFNHV